MGVFPSKENYSKSQFSQVRYRFLLKAPFEISNHCCSIDKKQITALYTKKTGRHPITAQTASESRLRTQVWLRQGCNSFEAKKQISNPMSFWTEQDVLAYIYKYKLPIASVYGDVVIENQTEVNGQMDLSQFGLFDLERPTFSTSGVNRTGCFACGYGCHMEKSPTRFEQMAITHPKLFDWIFRGGAFDENGLWKPKGGLGYWFIFEWCNVHGDMSFVIPNREYYIKKYSTDETRRHLQPNPEFDHKKKKPGRKPKNYHREE